MNQPFLPAENSPCSQPYQAYIAVSCVIGLAISYTSIWAQSLISATSFLAPWSGFFSGLAWRLPWKHEGIIEEFQILLGQLGLRRWILRSVLMATKRNNIWVKVVWTGCERRSWAAADGHLLYSDMLGKHCLTKPFASFLLWGSVQQTS